MSPAHNIPPAEIDAAQNWLLHVLATRTDHRLRLPNAMRLARQAGHSWRAVIAARRRAEIAATRDSDGEWAWTLPADAAAARRAA